MKASGPLLLVSQKISISSNQPINETCPARTGKIWPPNGKVRVLTPH
jgi:hypothetical protein